LNLGGDHFFNQGRFCYLGRFFNQGCIAISIRIDELIPFWRQNKAQLIRAIFITLNFLD